MAWDTALQLAKFLKCKYASDVPGWTSKLQHSQFIKLIEHLPDRPKILEIGCGYGRSTWAWLDVIPKNTDYYILDNFNLNFNDIFKPGYTGWRQFTKPEQNRQFVKKVLDNKYTQREIFDRIIILHKKYNNIKKIWHMAGSTWLDSECFSKEWDLVYLDDDHSYSSVKRWLEIFANVPIVCGDDYHTDWQGVVSAVNEYTRISNSSLQIMPDNFFVIKNT